MNRNWIAFAFVLAGLVTGAWFLNEAGNYLPGSNHRSEAELLALVIGGPLIAVGLLIGVSSGRRGPSTADATTPVPPADERVFSRYDNTAAAHALGQLEYEVVYYLAALAPGLDGARYLRIARALAIPDEKLEATLARLVDEGLIEERRGRYRATRA